MRITAKWIAALIACGSVNAQFPNNEYDPAASFYPVPADSAQTRPGFGPGSNAVPNSGNELASLTAAYNNETLQLLDNLRYELAGTESALQGEIRARAISAAIRQIQGEVGTGDLRRIGSTMTRVDRAMSSLAALLAPYGQDAQRTTISMDRIQRLTFRMRNLIGMYEPGGSGQPAERPPGIDLRYLAKETANLQFDIDLVSAVLWSHDPEANLKWPLGRKQKRFLKATFC